MITISKTRTKLLLYSRRSPATRDTRLLPSTSRSFLSAAALCLIALSIPLSATGQDRNEGGAPTQEELIERILELREQIEALLESLPPELQEEVERRWRERAVIEDEPAESVPADATGESVLAESEVSTARPESTVAGPPCGGFHLFDTNQDGVLSGGDRYWRFLRLWFDGDANGTIGDREIEGLFELGVRQIGVDLKSYQNDEGGSEDVDAMDLVWLRQLGKGKNKRRSGVLIVDATRLVRDGRLWLVTADGTQLDGLQPLGSAALVETRDGERLPVLCSVSP
jgi:hypothetical protein